MLDVCDVIHLADRSKIVFACSLFVHSLLTLVIILHIESKVFNVKDDGASLNIIFPRSLTICHVRGEIMSVRSLTSSARNLHAEL